MNSSIENPFVQSRYEDTRYYLSTDQVDSLRLELQVLTPTDQESYRQTELKLGEEFIRQFGKYLIEPQRRFILEANTIALDQGGIELLDFCWENGFKQDPNTASLNGRHFNLYRTDSSRRIGSHFAAGRLTVLEVQDYDLLNMVSPGALAEEKSKEPLDLPWNQEVFDQIIARISERRIRGRTRHYGGITLHEKVHGIQMLDLPLPFLEIAANYYEAKTFQNAGWSPRDKEEFRKAVGFWDILINEVGPDMHKWMFGNLPQDRFDEITAFVKSKFDEETFQRIFSLSEGENEVSWGTGQEISKEVA